MKSLAKVLGGTVLLLLGVGITFSPTFSQDAHFIGTLMAMTGGGLILSVCFD
jgi:hypothetical protein